MVRVGRAGTYDQHLVEPDAHVPVADGARDVDEVGQAGHGATVEEDEVVAGTVHFGEGEAHVAP